MPTPIPLNPSKPKSDPIRFDGSVQADLTAPRSSLAIVLGELEHWGAERGWVGSDPYEGLNTPAARLARSRRPRQAAIQIYKRLPIAPPWPLRASPQPNAKALALALSAYSTPAGSTLPNAERFLTNLPARLDQLKLLDGEHAGWGYPFDVQTRHLFYDRRTPNAIATCFVVGALLDAAKATGDSRPSEQALRARPFLLSLAAKHVGRPYFSYVRTGSELIHNANLLVCGTLARLHRLAPDEGLRGLVTDASATTVELQRPDGLWPYGEAENLQWADNFHTAYALEGLSSVAPVFGLGAPELKRGLAAWRARFFELDGWARYYPDTRFPLEAHCCASAIDLACALSGSGIGGEPAELRLFGELVAATAIRELWLEGEGRFAYRRGPRGLNRRAFMRWTNAPMFRALARLQSSPAESHTEGAADTQAVG
jgi:hypothetical protein